MAFNANDELIYLFTGSSEVFIKNRMNRIIQSYNPEETSVIRYDMESTPISVVLNDALTIPFLEKQKIIILRRPKFLKNTKDEEKQSIKDFIKYLKAPIDTTILMIDATNVNISNTNEIYKVLKNVAFIVNYDNSEEIEIKGWVIRTLAINNIEIKEDAINLFLEYLNNDQIRMEQEIDKLISYAGKGGVITTTDIKALINQNIDKEIYALIKAVINHDIAQTTALYESIITNTKDVMNIFSLLCATFRDLLTTSKLLKRGYSQNDIAKAYGVSTGRAYYMLKEAKAFKIEDLENSVKNLATLDYLIKSGQIDKNVGLELFLLKQNIK